MHWGAGSDKKRGAGSYERIVKETFEPILKQLVADAKRDGFLRPQAIYGYFPCLADGNEVVILDPQDYSREINRFVFPRQPGGERLCLADYFSPTLRDGQPDVMGLQVVTAGREASAYTQKLQEAGDYSQVLFVHGLASSLAEAVAEYIQQRERRELGLEPEQGKRYSWGYPACPDLEDQLKLFQLMPVTTEIGVEITEAYQLDPEQSTAALVVHHPAAKYYSTIDREALVGVS